MASSIHTIYRPLARSRRDNLSILRGSKRGALPSVSDVEDEQPPEEPVLSEEEIEEDFEPANADAPDPRHDNRRSLQMTLPPLPELNTQGLPPTKTKGPPSRSGSMATVKLQRRARLAEKLRDIFELTGIEEVIAGESCCCSVVRGSADYRDRDALLASSIYM